VDNFSGWKRERKVPVGKQIINYHCLIFPLNRSGKACFAG
jgi:hypothetical protein